MRSPQLAKTILIVDDDENNLLLLSHAIGKLDLPVRVLPAHGGEEVLDYLYARGAFADRIAGRPQLIIMDLHMPRMNGAQTTRKIRADVAFHAVPIVIFSSSSHTRDIEESLAAGASQFVTKPIGAEDYRKTIGWIVNRWVVSEQGDHPGEVTGAI
ncbi:MAG: response regulator [Usitatibacteraceae bacterium]